MLVSKIDAAQSTRSVFVGLDHAELENPVAALQQLKGLKEKDGVRFKMKNVTSEIVDVIVQELNLNIIFFTQVENFTVEAAKKLVPPQLSNYLFEDIELLPPESPSEADFQPTKIQTTNTKPSIGSKFYVDFLDPGSIDPLVGKIFVDEKVNFTITNGKKLSLEFGKAILPYEYLNLSGNFSVEFLQALKDRKSWTTARMCIHDGLISEQAQQIAEIGGEIIP